MGILNIFKLFFYSNQNLFLLYATLSYFSQIKLSHKTGMKKTYLLLPLLLLATAAYSQGLYIEFKMTSPGSDAVNGSMKAYAQDGNSRTEIAMSVPQLQTGAIQIVTLSLKSAPGKTFLLNEKQKTYSETEADNTNAYEDLPQADYEVTVLGKEVVNGYSATHVSVKVNGKQQEEMWTTKELAGYSEFSNIKTKYTGKSNLYQSLAAKGADGMPVRIKVNENGQQVQMDLVKAERRNNQTSLFSLTGYSKTESPLKGLFEGEGMQQLMEKLQDMTPEEREEMMKKIQNQYSKHPH